LFLIGAVICGMSNTVWLPFGASQQTYTVHTVTTNTLVLVLMRLAVN